MEITKKEFEAIVRFVNLMENNLRYTHCPDCRVESLDQLPFTEQRAFRGIRRVFGDIEDRAKS